MTENSRFRSPIDQLRAGAFVGMEWATIGTFFMGGAIYLIAGTLSGPWGWGVFTVAASIVITSVLTYLRSFVQIDDSERLVFMQNPIKSYEIRLEEIDSVRLRRTLGSVYFAEVAMGGKVRKRVICRAVSATNYDAFLSSLERL